MDCDQICKEIVRVLFALNDIRGIAGLLAGWLLAIAIGERFAGYTRKIQDNLTEDLRTSRKPASLKKKWNDFINIGDKLTEPNRWLGRCEVTLFYVLLFIRKPEAIGMWLVFKVAVKWESWVNIVKIPEKIENKKFKINEFDYLELRNKLATAVTQKFMIGTIGNILAAFIGIAIYFVITHIK